MSLLLVLVALLLLPRLLAYPVALAIVARRAIIAWRWGRRHQWFPIAADGLSGGYWMPRRSFSVQGGERQ